MSKLISQVLSVHKKRSDVTSVHIETGVESSPSVVRTPVPAGTAMRTPLALLA